MLETTAAWHSAVKAQFRYQAYLRFTLRLIPPGIHENMSVSGTETDPHSNVAILKDRATAVTPKKWATLEPNRWKLDGTWDVMDAATQTDDYWTKPIGATPPTLLFTFDAPYDIPGIYFEWDSNSNSWPTKIIVRGYDYAGAEQYTFTVTDIESATGFLSLQMDAVKSVKVEIHSWSKAGWRGRINEVLFGLNISYDSINKGRIKSATQISASEPLAERLPTHSMSIKLRNEDQDLDPLLKSGNSKYLAARQLVHIQWGFRVDADTVQWLDAQDFYLDSFEIPVDAPDVSLELTDRLSFLTDDFIQDVYTGAARTFQSVATAILNASSIIREYDGEVPWRLATKLANMSTTAPMPRKAVNYLLQLIAGATGLWLRTNPVDGYVQLDDVDLSTPVHDIGMMQELGTPGIVLQRPLRSITIAVYKYNKASTVSEIASGDYQINGTQVLTMAYNVDAALEVSATVTGGTLVSAQYYSAAAVLTISATNAKVKVVLSGKEVKGQATYIKTFEDGNVAQGVNVTLENPLVTESEYVAQLTEWIKTWYQKRQRYAISYLGYPELVAGDEITLTTIYGSQFATIARNQIDFNGGWTGSAEAL